MKDEIAAMLTAKDDKYACALADKIISESQETDEWYEYFDDFASLLDHPKSLVRNRVLHILAANAQWDEENRFDAILSDFLTHITDEKKRSSSARHRKRRSGSGDRTAAKIPGACQHADAAGPPARK